MEDTLQRALDGDFSARVKIDLLAEEQKSLGEMVNTAIERMAEAQKLKKRADAFVQFNPQAIAVLAPDKHRLDLNKQYEKAWRGSYDELMA
ncbi:MAG: methyl-accepting chemotaxis protein, partial [Methanofollis sp.]|nr:methyl-accepting chemotaxis protein [Methanofollis sp.]